MYWDYEEKEKPKKNIIFQAVNRTGSCTDFGSMFGGDPPYNLRDLCENCKADLVIMCGSFGIKQQLENETGQAWLKEARLDKFISGIIDVSVTGTDEATAINGIEHNENSRKKQKIREYLEKHEHAEYAIIDYDELEPAFPGHTVYMPESLDKSATQKAERLINYPPFKQIQNDICGSSRDLVNDHITKAIFLDIDGVLNDDGKRRREGEIICAEYVKNLAWIIDQTGAEIILSSSWRYGITHLDSNSKPYPDIQLLLDEFAKYHLRIAGMTPLYFNGPDGRPYEIRSWLARRPDLESFVILDDEDFWKWQWMSDRVVLTAKELPETKGNWWNWWEKGLSSEYAQKVVEILNCQNM